MTIWKHIQLDKEFNEWHLYIVGDGKDKSFYLDFTRNNNIPNVHFEGRRYPIPYYKRASIFAMTSAFEGFPMSIIEAWRHKGRLRRHHHAGELCEIHARVF